MVSLLVVVKEDVRDGSGESYSWFQSNWQYL